VPKKKKKNELVDMSFVLVQNLFSNFPGFEFQKSPSVYWSLLDLKVKVHLLPPQI
jgi:hypothetical protein